MQRRPLAAAGRPTGAAAPQRAGWGRRGGAALVLAVVLARSASCCTRAWPTPRVYFCNADEVGHRADAPATSASACRARSTTARSSTDGGTLRFTVTYNGATIPVRYQGEPGGIFQEGHPRRGRGPACEGTDVRRRPDPGEAHRAVHRGEPGPGSRRRAMTEQAASGMARSASPASASGLGAVGARVPHAGRRAGAPPAAAAAVREGLRRPRARSARSLAFVAMEIALVPARLLPGLRGPGRLVEDAAALQLRRAVELARGVDHPVGAHPGGLRGGRRVALPASRSTTRSWAGRW